MQNRALIQLHLNHLYSNYDPFSFPQDRNSVTTELLRAKSLASLGCALHTRRALVALRRSRPPGTSEVSYNALDLFLAELGDAPVHHAVDPVAHGEHTGPMGRDDIGGLGRFFQNIAKHLALGLHIQGTGGLVHQDQRRAAQQGTRDGNTLCLALGQAFPVLIDAAVDAVGHLLDKLPGAGQLQRLDDLVIRGIPPGQAQVLGDGAAEQSVPLRDVGDQGPGLGTDAQGRHIRRLQDAGAVLRQDHAEQQAQHRRLALAAGADQRGDLTRMRLEVRGLKHHLAILIGKVHLIQLQGQIPPEVLRRDLLLAVLFLRQSHQLLNTMGRDAAADKAGNDPDQALHRAGQGAALLQEEGHGAVSDPVAPEQVERVAIGNIAHQQAHEGHKDIGPDLKHVPGQGDVPILDLQLAQLQTEEVHDAEALHGVEVVERLGLEGVHPAGGLHHLVPEGLLLLHQVAAHQEDHRRAGQSDQGHHGTVIEDHDKGADEIINRDNQTRQPADGIGSHRTDVAVKAVQDIPVGKLIQRLPPRVHHGIEDIGADHIRHVHFELLGDASGKIAHRKREQGAPRHDKRGQPELVHLPPDDHVHQELPGDGRHQAEGTAEQSQSRIQRDGALKALRIGEDPLPVLEDFPESAFLPPLLQIVQGRRLDDPSPLCQQRL